MLETHLTGRIAGQQGLDRITGPGRTQRHKQPGHIPRVVEAGLADGPAGGAGDFGWFGQYAEVGDELGRGVGAARGGRGGP